MLFLHYNSRLILRDERFWVPARNLRFGHRNHRNDRNHRSRFGDEPGVDFVGSLIRKHGHNIEIFNFEFKTYNQNNDGPVYVFRSIR